jgi:hypothetical protein
MFGDLLKSLDSADAKEISADSGWKGKFAAAPDMIDIVKDNSIVKTGTFLSRPLEIDRSSPYVVISGAPPVGKTYIEIDSAGYMDLILSEIHNFARCINEMSVKYTETEIKNTSRIWEYMKLKKLVTKEPKK